MYWVITLLLRQIKQRQLILSQKKLTANQARWQDFLAEFDFMFQYKLGKTNFVADALSLKADLAAIISSTCRSVDGIKEGMWHDPVVKQLHVLAQLGKAKNFQEENGLLYTTGRRVCIPRWNNLRCTLIKEGHDTARTGHPDFGII